MLSSISGRDVDAGERSMPPLGLIEGRNAHQAVHADFAGAEVRRRTRRSPRRLPISDPLLRRAGSRRERFRIPGARPSANTCAEACRPSPAIRCRRRRDEWSRWRCAHRSSPESSVSVSSLSSSSRERIDFAVQVGVDVLAFAGQVEVGGDVFAAARQVGVGGQKMSPGAFFRASPAGIVADSTTELGRRPAFQFRLAADGVSPRQRYSRSSWTFLLQLFVFLFELLIHEDESTFLAVFRKCEARNAAPPNEIIAHSIREPVAVARVKSGYGGEGIGRDQRRALLARRLRRHAPVGIDRSRVSPVLVALSSQRSFSMARMRVWFRCWAYAPLSPYHPSFEMLTNTCAP